MNIRQEWVPTEEETPKDHWSKSPEYLAEKTAVTTQKTVPESSDTPAFQRGAKTVQQFDRRTPTHELAKKQFETPYVLTDEDKERIIREEAEKNKDIYEELAKDLLHKVDESFGY